MIDTNFNDFEIEVAELALEIENNINRKVEEFEILFLARMANRSERLTRAWLNSLILQERKTREEYDRTRERNRKRLMFFILWFVAKMSEKKSDDLCKLFDSRPSDGSSAMGMMV